MPVEDRERNPGDHQELVPTVGRANEDLVFTKLPRTTRRATTKRKSARRLHRPVCETLSQRCGSRPATWTFRNDDARHKWKRHHGVVAPARHLVNDSPEVTALHVEKIAQREEREPIKEAIRRSDSTVVGDQSSKARVTSGVPRPRFAGLWTTRGCVFRPKTRVDPSRRPVRRG